MKPLRGLTDFDVVKILELEPTTTARDVAVMYDLSLETVRRIWRGDTHRKLYKAYHAKRQPTAGEANAALDELLRRTETPNEPTR